jgi:flavodoxin
VIALSVLLIAALVASTIASSSSSSSTSSTENNADRIAFELENAADFEARLNTAVSKALLNKAQIAEFNPSVKGTTKLADFVRPFLKTYGVKSEREFEKTFELVDALRQSKRKRNAFVLSTSLDSSSDEEENGNAQDAIDRFLDSFENPDNKNAFRLAVLKEALVQHLRHGR